MMIQRLGSLTPAQIVRVARLYAGPTLEKRKPAEAGSQSANVKPGVDLAGYAQRNCAMTAKTTSERVAAMRAARDALGLKRLELYAHPEDWPAIKAMAEKLQRKRAKLLAKRAG